MGYTPGMSDIHPANWTLLTLLENQVTRTAAALEGLDEETYQAEPGNDCNSIRKIGEHLLKLRRFQLTLMESPLAADAPPPEQAATVTGLAEALVEATDLVRRAIQKHDPDDWFAVPATPREGPWGDLPTLVRLSRPFNDFTNHLGAVRAIRRIRGCGAKQTQ